MIFKKEINLLFVIAAVSAAIRLYINFYTEFIPGAVGSYYILQVRNILQSGHLYSKEFPLVFYLEALFAKIALLFGSGNLEKTADYTVRIFDAIVPAISIFPAFFLVKDIFGDKSSKYAAILISSLAVFFLSFFILVSEFQKNSLGILWLFFYLFYIHRALVNGGVKNYLFSFFFICLIGLTHFGCFSVSVFFTALLFLTYYMENFNLKKFIKIFLIVFTICLATFSVVYITTPVKVGYFADLFSQSFSKPIILSVLQGIPVISPADLIGVVFINLTSLAALYYFIKNRKNQSGRERVYFLSVIIASFILASPLLGSVWALRLYYISYILLIPQLAYIYKSLIEPGKQKIIVAVTGIVIIFSVGIILSRTPVSNMNHLQYAELQKIKTIIPASGTAMIVSREGLHYWTGLVFNKYIAQPQNVHKEWWSRIDHIYYLLQIKDIAPFGMAGLYGKPFPEPRIPGFARLVYSGQYYELYLLPIPPPGLKK